MHDLAEKAPGPFVLRGMKKRPRRVDLDDLTGVHEDDPVGDLPGEAHLVGYADHRHAILGEAGHYVEHFLYHLGVERRGGFIEQHHIRLHTQRTRNRDTLLLSAGKLARIFARLLWNVDTLEEMTGAAFRFCARQPQRLDRCKRAIFQDGKMREQVEALEHHPDTPSDRLDRPCVCAQRGAVDRDFPAIMRFKAVDAADKGRLSRTGRATDNDAFALENAEIDRP